VGYERTRRIYIYPANRLGVTRREKEKREREREERKRKRKRREERKIYFAHYLGFLEQK
jgi:hypothetical protein